MTAMSSAKWGLAALLLCMLLFISPSFAQEPVTAQSLLDTAWAKYQAKDYADAKADWLRVLADYPAAKEAPEAQTRLAYLLVK